MAQIKELPIAKIRRDSGAQFRPSLNEAHVEDLREAIQRGDTLPPVVVFFDGDTYWMGGGDHRIEAALREGSTKVPAEVREGSRTDARRYGRGDNAAHGLKRGIRTKRAQVEDALQDPDWASWSDRQIAKECKVSHPFVSQVRAELARVTGNVSSENRTFVTKHGTVAQMNTAKIGKQSTVDSIDIEAINEHLHSVIENAAAMGRTLLEVKEKFQEFDGENPDVSFERWVEADNALDITMEGATLLMDFTTRVDAGSEGELVEAAVAALAATAKREPIAA